MINILVLGCAMCISGLWCIYTDHAGIGIAYLGIFATLLCIENDREELEYLRNEVKKLNEAQPHR